MGDNMREKLKFLTVKNPRKENGDLGDIKCDFCSCQSGAYALIDCINHSPMICKGCLEDGIGEINKTILSGLK
ncbi:unnamed protein product [marine sediment metagenome]|uniref:Uncharacterized protein n=1 Tax=marine sediment metagenome TaxID=412755 RepID=X1AVJ7_9ZZZZ